MKNDIQDIIDAGLEDRLWTIKQLPEEEELTLLKTVQEKGADCGEMKKLCWTYMGKVWEWSMLYKDYEHSLIELLPIGVEAMEKAALTYEIGGPQKFRIYAGSVIKQYMKEAVARELTNRKYTANSIKGAMKIVELDMRPYLDDTDNWCTSFAFVVDFEGKRYSFGKPFTDNRSYAGMCVTLNSINYFITDFLLLHVTSSDLDTELEKLYEKHCCEEPDSYSVEDIKTHQILINKSYEDLYED